MNDLPTWAKDRARVWLLSHHWVPASANQLVPSLAALLVEVEAEGAADATANAGALLSREYPRGWKDALAEVRRVVEEVRTKWGVSHSVATLPCTEILSRLDALK